MLYVAPVRYEWSGLSVGGMKSARPNGTKANGFLIVFDSLEDFKAEYPDEEPIVLNFVGEEE